MYEHHINYLAYTIYRTQYNISMFPLCWKLSISKLKRKKWRDNNKVF